MRKIFPTLSLALTLTACAERPNARTPSWDVPIPSKEPRAELTIRLDLESVSDCDERFDLSLYEERGVELVTWDDDASRGHTCRERRVTVRYVPGRVTRAALLARIRQISRRVEVIER